MTSAPEPSRGKRNTGRPPLSLGAVGDPWLTERPNGGYIAGVWIRTPRGQRKQVTASGPTKGAARRKLQAKLDITVEPAAEGVQPTWTVAELASHWEEHKARSGHARRSAPLTAQSRWSYHSEIVRIIEPTMGDLRVYELSIALLESILAELEDSGLSTVNSRTVLHGMFDLGIRDGAMTLNPIDYIKRAPRESKEVEALDVDTARLLLEVVHPANRRRPGFRGPTRDLNDFCSLVLGTGARIGESLAVTNRLTDLDSPVKTITISGTMIEPRRGYVDKHHRQERTKNSEIRTLILPPAVAELLIERRAASRFTGPDEPLLASNRGTFAWAANMRERLRKAIADEPRLAGITPHTLRRTVADLIAYDVSLDAARMQLGHTLVGSTPLGAYVKHRQQVPDFTHVLDPIFEH